MCIFSISFCIFAKRFLRLIHIRIFGKGIRDLYQIEIARVGTKHEFVEKADEYEFRLVFEIRFVKQLFDDYKPIKLMIWRTFTDTSLRAIFAM